MTPVSIVCKKCKETLQIIEESLLGQDVQCPGCGSSNYVPLPENMTEESLSIHSPITKHQNTKACPMCGEAILIAAKKCKHCGEYLNGNKTQQTPQAPQVVELTSKSLKKELLKNSIGLLISIIAFILGLILASECTSEFLLFFCILGWIIIFPALVSAIFFLLRIFWVRGKIWWNHQ